MESKEQLRAIKKNLKLALEEVNRALEATEAEEKDKALKDFYEEKTNFIEGRR